MATGYGCNLFEIAFDAPTVTEIKAHARGAKVITSGISSQEKNLFNTSEMGLWTTNQR
jgi:hypothetical protein